MNSIMQNIFKKQTLFVCILISTCALFNGCSKTRKTYRVGILSGLSFVADITDGFKAKMTELGYIEGKNIVYDVKKTDFDIPAYKNVLMKFISDKVDLIVVFPTEATQEAKAATKGTNIPVLFSFALVEGMNIVDNLREPGGNITGVRYPGPDIALKRFEILCELAPKAKRILIPYQKGYPIVPCQLEVLRPYAESAGVKLIETPAANASELQSLLNEREKSKNTGIDAILIIVEPLCVTPDAFGVVSKFAYKHKIPIGGALMSAGNYKSIFGVNVNNIAVGKQTAPLADKILKGTPAGTIPVVSAESYFQLNYKAAREFGLDVSEGLVSSANEVIR